MTRGLCNKVPDRLKVRHRLYCIAEDTIWTYIHIFMCNTGNKIVICQLQNAKSNFPKFCKVYARQNQKTNLIHLHIYLVETIALILRYIMSYHIFSSHNLHILQKTYKYTA